jgi:hypothetical protein
MEENTLSERIPLVSEKTGRIPLWNFHVRCAWVKEQKGMGVEGFIACFLGNQRDDLVTKPYCILS